MLDWILSVKSDDDTSCADFNDLMLKAFDGRAKTGGVSQFALIAQRAGHGAGAVDALIDRDHHSLDENIAKMKDYYGPEKLKEMAPGEFYSAYKKFASGTVF